jgi:hypothetical protein
MTMTDAQIDATTLLLNDALAGDPDELRRLADQAAAVTPTGLRDQLDAARAEARAALRRMAPLLGADESPDIDTPEWARLGMLRTYVRWGAGRGSTCLHAPTATRPEPVVAAAWRPDLVACSRCPHLLLLRHASVADRSCDGCGRPVAGAEHGDGLTPAVVGYGPLNWLFGSCADCLTR